MEPEQREVLGGVGADDLGRADAAVAEQDLYAGGARDDVVVGDDLAVLGDDHAGPGGTPGGGGGPDLHDAGGDGLRHSGEGAGARPRGVRPGRSGGGGRRAVHREVLGEGARPAPGDGGRDGDGGDQPGRSPGPVATVPPGAGTARGRVCGRRWDRFAESGVPLRFVVPLVAGGAAVVVRHVHAWLRQMRGH
ncbi:hypothetical protein LUX12_05370 [Streptomyces somaliensis]|nr:hypothetical protein [Streptomyces somaliensis]